jgi:hypothetical protein
MPCPQDSTPVYLRSALWGDLLDRAIEQISAAPTSAGTSRSSLIETAVEATASADARLLVALESGSSSGAGLVSEALADAVALMLAVAALWQRARGAPEIERGELVEQLRRRLSGHEEAVLAGEITYSVRLEQAEQSSARLRHAIASLSREETMSDRDLLLLRSEAVDLTSLLVLAAANTAASGSASGAPEPRTAALDHALSAITGALGARAQRVERPVDARGDVVAHHFASGLRVRISSATLDRLDAGSANGPLDAACQVDASEAWWRLATDEYVAVSALDSQLATPTYDEPFGDLATALVEGAANVICGARLLGRPGSFRHRRAWGHHAIALTYALEAYVAGLRGDSSSFAQAQLIALTRLVRAIAAIAVLELRRADALPTNGKLGSLSTTEPGSERTDA